MLFNFERFVGKAFLLSFALTLFVSFAAVAQEQQTVETDFSEEELEQFVDVFIKANKIQQENEAEMIQAIEEEDLDVNRFNEILMSRQQQEGAEEIDATAEELASFNQAAEKIMEVQQQAQGEIEQLIEENMGRQKYQQMIMAYQQDPELQERINNMLAEEME